MVLNFPLSARADFKLTDAELEEFLKTRLYDMVAVHNWFTRRRTNEAMQLTLRDGM